MITFFRNLFWKFLGINYYKFLSGRNMVNLKDANWVKIGNKSYDNGAYVWKWYEKSELIIGNYCSIANNVNFICDSGYHQESEITTFPLFHHLLNDDEKVKINNIEYQKVEIANQLKPKKSGIIVGNDVWIGLNVTVLPGVKIGNGVTILAGSTVSKDIPDYAIIGGFPAEIIKYKHSNEIIEKLNKIQWWNWSDKKMKDTLNDFYLPIEEFTNKYV